MFRFNKRVSVTGACAGVFLLGLAGVLAREFDLRPKWDDQTPLANPHKGWYHHYPDNHVNKYVVKRDGDLVEFPGMDHLYIRLAWAYLEPAEGQFNWKVIDELIEKWTGHGLGISFRISCKETSTDRPEQQFATPKWVMEAGAKGGYYRSGKPVGPDGPWEPRFDDPVFLAKLENFLRAFAARYDGRTWLRYVDIGSIGDWGEGHCWAGSQTKYGFEVRKQHVDLHLKYFQQSQLVTSDDFVYEVPDTTERRRLHQYMIERGISYRDDSILVEGYFAGHSRTATVRSPEYFADAYTRFPTVFELEHYSAVKRRGNWTGTQESALAKHGGGRSGADFFREALWLLHASYIGYHGDAAEWRTDNATLSNELLNRCGYWYFIHRAETPDVLRAGQTQRLLVTWENRGVAPAYQAFQLLVRLEGTTTLDLAPMPANNREWAPSKESKVYKAEYPLALPKDAKPGTYQLKVKLHSPQANRDVLLALKQTLFDKDRYYLVGDVRVE